jgi:ParB family chromosome partitioning protein
MAELRSVDPRTLIPNPDNPRRTAPSKSMDEQLLASIRAIGLIQPPRVAERDGKLMIVAGVRRTKAAIAADLAVIDVLIDDADETTDAMRSVSENLIRASMTSVDIWRATEALEGQGWNEQAIADALALPVRTVKRLKLLAHLHPAMLDFMAIGSMPNEEQLRTIAAALRDEQAQVWRKLKPKKGHDVSWHEVARALSKRRIPASAARFDDDLARAYGVIWEDDLFAPAGEDSRTTTNVDGFFGAQQEWLPKKAEFVYGKPAKGDLVGHYLDVHSGEVKTTVYRIVEPRRAAKGGKENENVDIEPTGATPKATRAEVSQKGVAMIGDFRTDALHEALKVSQIDETTLIALLVVAFGGRNVSVQSGAGLGGHDREGIALNLTDGGVLTTDPETVHAAARAMLTLVLSCRDNASSSGPLARSAGDTIGASLHLPNMATDDFLSCLSKAGVEKAAAAEGVRVEVRGKDTRANLVDRFKDGLYVYPPALFKLTDDEIAGAKEARSRRYVPGAGASLDDDQDGEVGTECDGEEDGGSLHGVDEDEEAFEADAEMAHAAE